MKGNLVLQFKVMTNIKVIKVNGPLLQDLMARVIELVFKTFCADLHLVTVLDSS